jgi:hypothetical protein
LATNKSRLYLDVDDTIIAVCHKGSGFDLRPGVLTQLQILTRLYDCVWLTCWPRTNVYALIKALYGSSINSKMTYANWDHSHPWRKAGYVLDPSKPQNFWWLEDPLCKEELDALHVQDKMNRYVRVEPFGPWAFLDSVNELFKRTGVDDQKIKRVGGNPDWFKKETILTENHNKENIRETLSMVELILGTGTSSPEDRLKEVRAYLQHQLDTMF